MRFVPARPALYSDAMQANLPAFPKAPDEAIRYMARPGLAALPSGTFQVGMFVLMQGFVLVIFIWAIWWPFPKSTHDWLFAILGTSLLMGLALGVLYALLRMGRGLLRGIAMAPFIRVTVTDRRVLWSLPWAREPLLEVGLARVRGAMLGEVDRRGRGAAAMLLMPGDPAADDHGYIHFDRLPRAEQFVAALSRA